MAWVPCLGAPVGATQRDAFILLCVGVMLLGSLLYPTFQDFCLLKSCMIKTILDFSFFQFEKRSFRGV